MAATAEFARFLREELAPRGPQKQAVGRDRYAMASRYFLGVRFTGALVGGGGGGGAGAGMNRLMMSC